MLRESELSAYSMASCNGGYRAGNGETGPAGGLNPRTMYGAPSFYRKQEESSSSKRRVSRRLGTGEGLVEENREQGRLAS